MSGDHLPVPPGPAGDGQDAAHHAGGLDWCSPAGRLPADAPAVLQVSGGTAGQDLWVSGGTAGHHLWVSGGTAGQDLWVSGGTAGQDLWVRDGTADQDLRG